jgi:hypothetical protein
MGRVQKETEGNLFTSLTYLLLLSKLEMHFLCCVYMRGKGRYVLVYNNNRQLILLVSSTQCLDISKHKWAGYLCNQNLLKTRQLSLFITHSN